MDRAEAIARIRKALRARSGKAWSVTGGRGTAWGWLTIDAPPARRTWHQVDTGRKGPDGRPVYEWIDDPGHPFGYTGPAEREELAKLLGLDRPVHHQGESVPASNADRRWYVARAEGRDDAGEKPAPYWD